MPRIIQSRVPVFAGLIIGLIAGASPTLAQVIYEDLKLLAADGEQEDRLGRSIASADGMVVVGALYDDDHGTQSGSAYLFDAASGVERGKLRADDGAAYDHFGHAVAIDQGIVAVGAWGDHNDLNIRTGAAYLFDAATGRQIAKLVATDGADYDLFGYSIAIADGIVVVGARNDDDLGDQSGSAYLFDAASGRQFAKLLPHDGFERDEFGISVAINDGIVAVGAQGDFDSRPVYLFDATTGEPIRTLQPNDGVAWDRFGLAIAIDKNVVAVGAFGAGLQGTFVGAAYLFDANTGDQLAKLTANDGEKGDDFGSSIAIDNGIVAVSASGDEDNGAWSGSAYLFDATTGRQIAKLLASDGHTFHGFGRSIALDNGIAAVGADGDRENALGAGAAYLFDTDAISNCLRLIVDNLKAGEEATFSVSGGTPGAKGVTVYGTKPGHTFVYRYAGYCATFGIKGVHQAKVLGGFDRIFDANGEITFKQDIPWGAAGAALFFQSAERGTCPDECVSNRVTAVVR